MLAGDPQFRLLGPLDVTVAGSPVQVRAGKQRVVLAALLLRANTPVSADELIEHLWGATPPHGARDTVRAYVMRLRQLLGDRDVIVTTPAGYMIKIQPAQLDLLHVRELTDAAEALSLWRGPALQDIPSDSLQRGEASRLAEFRLQLVVRRIERDLSLGRHAELVAELTSLVTEHPLHERLCGQLMLALYRCGRVSEALARYRLMRARLAEEIGTDPGHELRDLHQRILNADKGLALSGPSSSPVPRQLPGSPQRFTGRAEELAELDRGGTVVVSAIDGTGGIGKTWLALHWAHRNLDRFPDGQLYVNLRGFDPTVQPMPTSLAVRAFLGALGVPPTEVPGDLDAQVGLYRSLVADKRMLVVLDNARDTAQATPLLPGSPTCMALVTSRHQLAGLVVNHGATLMTLDVLSEAEARQVLVGRLGDRRINAEPEAVRELVDRCAGLPLALGIVAARAAMQPQVPLAALADELRKMPALDALDAGELGANLRAVFACSYNALSEQAAHMFRLLGLAPGPDIGLAAVQYLTGFDDLRELLDAHLVQEHVPGRYRMHDLVRQYAAEQAQSVNTAAALRGLTDFYLRTAHSGELLLYPQRAPIELEQQLPTALTDEASALAWFETEHSCLLAAQHQAETHGWDEAVWQFAWAMSAFHYRHVHLNHQLGAWLAGLAATRRLDDPVAEALAHRRLGDAYARINRHAEASGHLRDALELTERIGDRVSQAQTHVGLAWALEQQGEDEGALTHATQALNLLREFGNPVWEAAALNAVGWYHARLGQYEQARPACEQALALFREHADRESEAAALDSLGYIGLNSGDHAEAVRRYLAALRLRQELGNHYETATTMEHLGQAQHAVGEDAMGMWQQAFDLYQAQGRFDDAKRVQQLMDSAAADRR